MSFPVFAADNEENLGEVYDAFAQIPENSPLPLEDEDRLLETIDPLAESPNEGIDLCLACLDFVERCEVVDFRAVAEPEFSDGDEVSSEEILI